MKRTFGTAILASLLAFGLVTSAWSAEPGTSTTAPHSQNSKKHKSHHSSKKHEKGKKDDASQTQK